MDYPVLASLIEAYKPATDEDYEYSLREIVQHLALLGLWRAKFYEYGAFYGGTALRIFHGLQRFSEDIDFSLLKPDPGFKLGPFLKAIEQELAGFGFSMEVIPREKRTNIRSAFIKGNTVKNLLLVNPPAPVVRRYPGSQTLKVKLELDTDPPAGAEYEVKTVLIPIPFQVKLFSLPDLFAGKVHAVLCRGWQERVKGRDYYDFLWYIAHKTECRLGHLRERFIQTNDLPQGVVFNGDTVIRLLTDRFNEINFRAAKKDVEPFIRDRQELELWNREFFKERLGEMRFC
jgi:predicted nucleotidyltransferase component of viral defense system